MNKHKNWDSPPKQTFLGNALLCCLISLLASCSTAPRPFYADEEVFAIGTYQSGNNLTEPRPAESKYFRTIAGGFVLNQRFAAYKVAIEVTRKPEQRYYTRAILQNPTDPKAPFVYEHYIDPETPNTTLTHGPVRGLSVYDDYVVQFVLFEDEARTQEIDRLTQPIRSYVDTTTDNLFLYDRLQEKAP